MVVDLSKTYKTKDGHDVRLYCVDGAGTSPVHGAYKAVSGWLFSTWNLNGKALSDAVHSARDLVEVKPRIQREVWVEIYPKGVWARDSKGFTDTIAGDNCMACVKVMIDCEEGAGL